MREARDSKEKIDSGIVPYPKDIQDWRTSLNTVHSEVSMQPIPSNKVEF